MMFLELTDSLTGHVIAVNLAAVKSIERGDAGVAAINLMEPGKDGEEVFFCVEESYEWIRCHLGMAGQLMPGRNVLSDRR